jgi:hypothetical protein
MKKIRFLYSINNGCSVYCLLVYRPKLVTYNQCVNVSKTKHHYLSILSQLWLLWKKKKNKIIIKYWHRIRKITQKMRQMKWIYTIFFVFLSLVYARFSFECATSGNTRKRDRESCAFTKTTSIEIFEFSKFVCVCVCLCVYGSVKTNRTHMQNNCNL